MSDGFGGAQARRGSKRQLVGALQAWLETKPESVMYPGPSDEDALADLVASFAYAGGSVPAWMKGPA